MEKNGLSKVHSERMREGERKGRERSTIQSLYRKSDDKQRKNKKNSYLSKAN